MKYLLALWLCGSLAIDPENEKTQTLENLSWLTGAWHIPGEKTQYYEYWEKKNDSLYTGKGMTLRGTDTLFFESIEIKRSGNDIYYVVSSRDQNEGNTVAFQLISGSEDTFIFENAGHDYPQRIVYRHPSADSLAAYIEGTVDGNYRRSDFPMVRKP